MTLVIYDISGTVYFQAQGDVQEPAGGLLFMWIEIPSGKILKSIDTSCEEHEPVFEDLPKADIDTVKEQLVAIQIALAEVLGV